MNNLVELKNIDLKNASEDFISYLDVNECSLYTYKEGIKHFLEYLQDNNIKQPTRIDFKNYRNSLKGKLTTNTINNYLTANRCFFRYLEINNLYENITKDVKSIKTSSIPVKQTLSQEKCQEIYKSLTDKREKCIFSLMVSTGLRANEVALAKLDNIKEYNGEIVLFVKCKKRDDESEYVKLSDRVLQDIKDYVEHRTNGYIFTSTSNKNIGQGVTNKTIRLIVKNILRRFGFDENSFSCHSLRKTCATLAYNNGASIYDIKEVLHHRSIVTTQRYISQTTRDNNKTEQNISKLIFG